MQEEKFISINEVFKDRKEFIPEVGRQLENKKMQEVEINGEKINIDYREISVTEKEDESKNPVIVLPGFGSGWEGIAELGFSLSCEGRKVILPSLPGYGNSQNPTEKYYDTDNFDNEAEVISQLIDGLNLGDKKMHLVGHSMSSEILATLAQKYPEKVSSLVLLNPAGVNEDENAIKLSAKFIASGLQTSMEFHTKSFFAGEKDYEEGLYSHISKPESPFSKERFAQRLAEAKKVSKGHLLEKIKEIKLPVTYITGELDTVYPPGEKVDEDSQLARIVDSVNNEENINTSVMKGLRHNTTLAPDEITAANIDHYLELAE
ncbi:MAG TPA: alpha/beta fold hydrolase [Candidatus Pacebacteria bacterium]|nr:alpha/beta fold hydrolase [Candidatus Paceibacterota bacterium]